MVKVSSVEGNRQLLDGGSMFGNAPRAVWQKWVEVDELGRIPLACRSLLIEIDGVKILCETGIGAFFEPKLADRFGVQDKHEVKILENLKSLNVDPDDIDFVILSHLHFDHAGGLMPKYEDLQAGVTDLNFKKAKYVVGEEAFERAVSPHPRDRASFIPGLTDMLKSSERLVIVEKDAKSHTLLPSQIEFIYSHGHTPGQMLTQVSSDSQRMIFTGDLIPGTHWVHLPITMGYDRYAEKVIDEKANLYNQLDLKSSWFFFTHDAEYVASKVIVSDSHKYMPNEKQTQLKHFLL